MARQANPLIIVISGPSGVGKDAVIRRITEIRDEFHFIVTATTRAPRPKEVDGVNHIFVSEPRFRQMIADGELLEWAETYGNLYGTPKEQVRDALAMGRHVLLRIDVQGAMSIRKLVPDALLLFITVQDKAVLEARLGRREGQDAQDFATRLAAADAESEFAERFDYVIDNEDGRLAETVQEVIEIIDRESSRVPARMMTL